MGGRVSAGVAVLGLPGAGPRWTRVGARMTPPRMRVRVFRREADPLACDGGGEASPLSPAEAENRAPDLIAACVRGDEAARREFVFQYDGLIRYSILIVLRQRSVVLTREELEDLHQVVLASFFERSCR